MGTDVIVNKGVWLGLLEAHKNTAHFDLSILKGSIHQDITP